MVQNKFIRQTGKSSSSSQAPQQRKVIEEVGDTQTFAFPQRGQQASPQEAPATQPTPQPTSEPTQKEKPYAEIDANYVSIDLPSRFQFYDAFKTLSSCTLKGAHQAKLSRANKEGRLRYVVEALSATLEPSRSAFVLTPGDFYFLMYWQRVNSFSKNPLIVTTYCDNEEHNHAVYIGTEVDDPDDPGNKKIVKKAEDTLKNETFLQSTTLDSVYAEPVDVTHLSINSKYLLDVERMQDVVEASEFLQDAKEPLTEETLFLMAYAPFLKTGPGQMTLVEKMKVVGEMTADDLCELDEYRKLVTQYGVSEYGNIRCKECGASTRVSIPFDALTFLPNGR